MKTLKQFIGRALATFEYRYPPASDFENLEAWHNHCMAMNKAQDEQVQQLVVEYAAILNGQPPNQRAGKSPLLCGPWRSSQA